MRLCALVLLSASAFSWAGSSTCTSVAACKFGTATCYGYPSTQPSSSECGEISPQALHCVDRIYKPDGTVDREDDTFVCCTGAGNALTTKSNNIAASNCVSH